MATQSIPREQWNNFFDSFSRQHEGWLATLEVFDNDIGAQEQAHELPLSGISLSSAKDEDSIALMLGKEPGDHITHIIEEPEQVWIEKTADGVNAALEIESKDQTKTLLRFRSAMLPELVDGVVFD
ncbi:MAG TPA: DUF5335 family protein [Pyrinomonadaceae bacterium]|nr:DUF5335 family protein [Pyrinomonadaceae bacterium]